LSQNGLVQNAYGFSTKEYNSKSGLIYFGARYYDPRIGRFITKDPILALNLYVYCKNNPLNLVDPFGLDTYYINRVMGGESTQDPTPTNNSYSHSFVAITDKGTVTDTFSWGNGGQSRWFHNDPLDMAAAQKAIDSGVGIDRYGGEDLDPFVSAEYEKRKNETDPYNVATNNCKQKAGRLLKDAMQQKKKKEKLK
jgi:RHS repeat-associated protein